MPCFVACEINGTAYALCSDADPIVQYVDRCTRVKSVSRPTLLSLAAAMTTISPSKKLQLLKSAKTLHDVAALLNYKPHTLSYILYKKPDGAKYKKFEIPKRFGGTRLISAPLDDLKVLQRNLATLLQDCVEVINEANGLTDQMAHGFKRDRSITSNAKPHRNRRFVFNLDLSDFFGTINFGRVRGFFIKDKNFALDENVAKLLAKIACFESKLPQGSPCSPVISNLIGHVLDIHLVRLAANTGCTYTRYADDLTFSTNHPIFPISVAKTSGDKHTWAPGKELERLIKKSGFEINATKTRMQYYDSRQEVTGLVVNRKLNVRSEYRHKVRAMVHSLLTTGKFDFIHKSKDAAGTETVEVFPGKLDQLHGMLGFINGVDLYNRKLLDDNPFNHPKRATERLSTKETMYLRFLLFKVFYAADQPVIICEGKTDNVYLTHAIRGLANEFPELASKGSDGKISLNVRIFKYANKSTGRIFGNSSGGAPGLSKLMRHYHTELKKFKAPGGMHPMIFLVDNDSGATDKGNVFGTIAQITGKPKPTGHEDFMHVIGNMYVVPTPLNDKANKSCIEDFFDESTKAISYLGKTFDASCPKDTATHYGKATFAYEVVKPNSGSINWSKFKPLLKNLVGVIDKHKKHHAPANVAP